MIDPRESPVTRSIEAVRCPRALLGLERCELVDNFVYGGLEPTLERARVNHDRDGDDQGADRDPLERLDSLLVSQITQNSLHSSVSFAHHRWGVRLEKFTPAACSSGSLALATSDPLLRKVLQSYAKDCTVGYFRSRFVRPDVSDMDAVDYRTPLNILLVP